MTIGSGCEKNSKQLLW